MPLSALHEALTSAADGGGQRISEAQFTAAVHALLPSAVDRPAPQVIASLFRVFDSDGSGDVDEAELIAGCAQLCSGQATTRLELAFRCFDRDGDGHLDRDEIADLLRKTIEPAVQVR